MDITVTELARARLMHDLPALRDLAGCEEHEHCYLRIVLTDEENATFGIVPWFTAVSTDAVLRLNDDISLIAEPDIAQLLDGAVIGYWEDGGDWGFSFTLPNAPDGPRDGDPM